MLAGCGGGVCPLRLRRRRRGACNGRHCQVCLLRPGPSQSQPFGHMHLHQSFQHCRGHVAGKWQSTAKFGKHPRMFRIVANSALALEIACCAVPLQESDDKAMMLNQQSRPIQSQR